MVDIETGNSNTNNADKTAHRTNFSVKEVTNAVPSESEEETSVLKSLDSQAPNNQPLKEGLLEGVPEESSHIFSTSNRPNTVEEALADLVEEFNSSPQSQANTTTNDNNNESKKNPRRFSILSTSFGRDADKLIQKARVIHYKKKIRDNARDTYEDFVKFLSYQKPSIWTYGKYAFILAAIFIGVAVALFYLARPDPNSQTASSSWWLIFVVRQMCTYTLAKATEAVLIDFLCLNNPILLKALGPYLTLLLVQSRGWPFQLLLWSCYDMGMLFGDRPFAKHWMYYQDLVPLFSPENPAGKVTSDSTYRGLLVYAMFTGAAYTLKRFFMGLWYGRTVYQRFGKDLSIILRKSMWIKKLAKLSKEWKTAKNKRVNIEDLLNSGETTDEDTEQEGVDLSLLIQTDKREGLYHDSLADSQKLLIKQLLGEWEEPLAEERLAATEKADISAIVQFRTAISLIDPDYPFSTHFGPADTREACIDSAQKLYLRLKPTHEPTLHFDRIAVVAQSNHNSKPNNENRNKDDKNALQNNEDLHEERSVDEAVIKELIKLFRPTRDGEMSILDFVKSIDTVYKELRLLQASIWNLQKMHSAFQKLWDTVFHLCMAWFFLLAIGIDPIAVVGSFTAIIVGFSFMVGNALSKTFEGLLFVLVRQPYDVGDRIAVAGIDNVAPGEGSLGWIVKDLTLYTSTLVYGTTGEEATFTNGYLNAFRVINMNRSPKAILSFLMKFGIDVGKDKIEAFGKAVEEYVKGRPREWISFAAYRMTGVQADLGYVEYKIILQHRESWQQIGALLNSKSDVQLFAFELSKNLQMGYRSPPMPIILNNEGVDQARNTVALSTVPEATPPPVIGDREDEDWRKSLQEDWKRSFSELRQRQQALDDKLDLVRLLAAKKDN